MNRNCPACGTSTEFDTRVAHVLQGHCESCGGVFTIVQEGTGAVPSEAGEAGASAVAAPRPSASGENEEHEGPVLSCNSCGDSLVVQASSPATLETTCSGCGEIVRYVASTGAPYTERRGRGAARERTRGPPMGAEGPARPCRECGGTLTFTPGEDGTVTGECSSCGNRFTLPARRDRGERGGPREGGYRGGRSGPGRFNRGGRYGGAGRGGGGRDRPGRPPGAGRRYGGGGGYGRRREDGDDRRERRRKRYDDE